MSDQKKKLIKKYYEHRRGENAYHDLMPFRIKKIMMISTLFDSFTSEFEGRLYSQIYGEYKQLNLSYAPKIISVSVLEDIIDILKTEKIDLITIVQKKVSNYLELISKIREIKPDINIVLLIGAQSQAELMRNRKKLERVDYIFYWSGNPELYIAIIKLIEDRINFKYDLETSSIGYILYVERSIKEYSKFLPILYTEIIKQMQTLLNNEFKIIHKRTLMKLRPKVIKCENYNEALDFYFKNKKNILSLITNSQMERDGELDYLGGVNLIKKIKADNNYLPVLLQSFDYDNKKISQALGIKYLNKNSNSYLNYIKHFLRVDLGFGDFIFMNSNKRIEMIAKSIYEMPDRLNKISDNCLEYHCKNNHFSIWLKTRNEFDFAKIIEKKNISDFSNLAEVRNYLLEIFTEIFQKKNNGKILEYNPFLLLKKNMIIRLAEGSLGGKGRGLAFLNSLLNTLNIVSEEETDVVIPFTAIIGTNEFDDFLLNNNLDPETLEGLTDKKVNQVFLKGKLTSKLVSRLSEILEVVKFPLAIRSSGLLEDSQADPFAGIYQTFFLPNNDANSKNRLLHLCNAIKLVMASPFLKDAKDYINSINYKVEEEKMAIIIQEIGGSQKNKDEFYPLLSGVLKSFCFYSPKFMKPNDGVCELAVGLGKIVVDGESSFQYSPKFPKKSFLDNDKIVEKAQRKYYSLNLTNNDFCLENGETTTLNYNRISKKLKNTVFKKLTSVWDYEYSRFIDSYYTKGPRVITFRNINEYGDLGLNNIFKKVMDIGEFSMGVPVEIEFCVDKKNDKFKFYLLQIRPLMIDKENVKIFEDEINSDKCIIRSGKIMGNGVFNNIKDIIYVDPEKFDVTDTIEMKEEIVQLNSKLKNENKKYILIGPGRWGTRDRFLGIPVKWSDISQAKVIIEANIESLQVEPSQASHFFHNIASQNVGYFTIPLKEKNYGVNWKFLNSKNNRANFKYFKHIVVEEDLTIKMDGIKQKGIVFLKNEKNLKSKINQNP